MTHFQPAHSSFRQRAPVSWGAEIQAVTPENAQAAVDALAPPPSAIGEYDEYIAYFNKSADGLKTLLFGKDARTTAAILRARLVNLQKDKEKYGKIPVVGKLIKGFIENQIRSTRAEYNAAATQAQEEQYAANTKLVIGTLTVGLGVLSSLALLQYIAFIRARTKAIS
jgi:hypothetical protein